MKRLMVMVGSILSLGSGCAATGHVDVPTRIAEGGPSVSNSKAVPAEIDLNKEIRPDKHPEILADVRDPASGIDTVKLRLFFSDETDDRVRYFKVPMDIEMKPLQGDTWHAVLTEDQLRSLAMSGHSLTYEARVIARDSDGHVTVSNTPIELRITGPNVNKG